MLKNPSPLPHREIVSSPSSGPDNRLSEHAEYATAKAAQLISWYRKSDDWSSDEFMVGIAANLAQYPKDIIDQVCHPAKGIAARMKFPPNPAEVRDACEAIMEPRRKLAQKRIQIEDQLKERDEHDGTVRPRQTIDQVKEEMIARGFNWGGEEKRQRELVSETRQRLIMTLAMNQKVSLEEAARLFDEMEEGPKSQWQKTQDVVRGVMAQPCESADGQIG